MYLKLREDAHQELLDLTEEYGVPEKVVKEWLKRWVDEIRIDQRIATTTLTDFRHKSDFAYLIKQYLSNEIAKKVAERAEIYQHQTSTDTTMSARVLLLRTDGRDE